VGEQRPGVHLLQQLVEDGGVLQRDPGLSSRFGQPNLQSPSLQNRTEASVWRPPVLPTLLGPRANTSSWSPVSLRLTPALSRQHWPHDTQLSCPCIPAFSPVSNTESPPPVSLIKAFSYPSPVFSLLRLFNCTDQWPLSGQSHLEQPLSLARSNQEKTKQGLFPPKETPLKGIKLNPANCHFQPIKATHRGKVTVPWDQGIL
jgi:hypothetical protein